MNFNVISGILTGLVGIVCIVLTVVADVSGRRRFAFAAIVAAVVLVAFVVTRFVVLG